LTALPSISYLRLAFLIFVSDTAQDLVRDRAV
jgi:hypothetical protein